MANGYQSFKQISTRDVYCSKNKFKSHDDAKKWVTACLNHYSIQANDTKDYNYPENSQPAGAIIYPS